LDSADQNLTYEKCGIAFASGDAAVTIRGSSAQSILKKWQTPQVTDHLGVAMVPGIPWVGGANLVIWKEAQMQLEAERSAIALVNFLSTTASQVKLAQASGRTPSRVDALEQHHTEYASFKSVIQQSIVNGRSYHPVRHWVRIMSELRNVLDAITSEVISSPTLALKEILDAKLTPLANRFSLMLSK
jgi:ABC-type glycerol-3-phosphate transport system substrate-binding protein